MRKGILYQSAVLLFSLASLIAFGGESAAAQADDLSLADLLNLTVTTASKRPEKLNESPATVYVVTEDDILKYGYVELKDILANLPGVTTHELDFFTCGGQRGFLGNFSQTLLLVNGREMQNLIAAETFISRQFDTHNIKRIEVVQGPGSALYGANALVGVINIITKSNDSNFDQFDVGVDYGSNSTKAYNISFGKKLGDFRISGSVRAYGSDRYNFTDFFNDRNNFSSGTPDAKVRVLGDANSYYRYANKSTAYPMAFKLDYKDFYIGTESYYQTTRKGLEKVSPNPQEQLDERNLQLYYLGWTPAVSDDLKFKFELDYWYEKFNSRNYVATDTLFDEKNGTPVTTATTPQVLLPGSLTQESQENSNGSRRIRLDTQVNYHLTSWDSYLVGGYVLDFYDTMGIHVDHYSLTPPFNNTVDPNNSDRRDFYQRTRNALYVQLQKAVFDEALNITLGTRFDIDSLSGSVFTPRGGLVWKVDKDTNIRAAFGTAFRAPSIFDQGALNPKGQSKDIHPSKSLQIELGGNHNFGKSVVFNAVAYQAQQTDAIVEGGTGIYTNDSSKKTSRGVESQLFGKVGGLTAEVSYGYNHIVEDQSYAGGTYNSLGLYPHRISSGLSYAINNVHNLALRYNYYPSIQAMHGNSSVKQVIPVDSASVVDLTYSVKEWKLSDKGDFKLTGFLHVNNLFDTAWFQPNVRQGGAMKYAEPGREIIARLTLNF